MTMRCVLTLSIIILFCSVLAEAQVMLTAASAPSTPATPKVDVPRQLTLERAEEILLRNNLTVTSARYGVDIVRVAEGELIKFQSNKVQYERDLVTSQLGYQQAARDVLNILGAEPKNVAGLVPTGGPDQPPRLLADAPVDIVGDLKAEAVITSLDELRQVAIVSRPDVIAAQCSVDAAQQALDLAYSLRHRDVDIGWEYQRNGAENTFGIVVSVPVFAHNNHQGDIDQALAQLQQARTQLIQVKLQAMTDVDKAYRAYESSQRMLGVYTAQTVQKAEESFRIAGVSYKEGASSLLELRDAQRTYNQTRVASNQAHFDYRISLYQLELATGKPQLK
jgi:outer membrane protein, heavy metal efflux system